MRIEPNASNTYVLFVRSASQCLQIICTYASGSRFLPTQYGLTLLLSWALYNKRLKLRAVTDHAVDDSQFDGFIGGDVVVMTRLHDLLNGQALHLGLALKG